MSKREPYVHALTWNGQHNLSGLVSEELLIVEVVAFEIDLVAGNDAVWNGGLVPVNHRLRVRYCAVEV